MPLYELINPSDPYTFEAPNLEVASVAACLLSTRFGAKPVGDEDSESTPVLVGWDEWLNTRGIDGEWIKSHRIEIAAALDSFLIGKPGDRADVEDMLAELPEEKRKAWRAHRQDRHRTSMNRIGEEAYQLAEQLRGKEAEPDAP